MTTKTSEDKIFVRFYLTLSNAKNEQPDVAMFICLVSKMASKLSELPGVVGQR